MVVGAGTMGVRIAVCLARAGVEVWATARRPATRSAAARELAAVAAPAVAARVHLAADVADVLGDVELVVETITEDLDAKVELLRRLDRRCASGTLVTTNTSSLDVDSLAGALARPGRFAGLHWFNPADLVELVEVVPARLTDTTTVEVLAGWMSACGKQPVVLRRAAPGFVANRLQYALLREAYALVEAGVCTAQEADLAVTRGLGPRWAAIGPFEAMDLAGLDVHLAVALGLFPHLSGADAAPRLVTGLVEAGDLGAKSGRGLLGEWSPDRRRASVAARDRMLRLVAATRDDMEGGDETGPGGDQPRPAEGGGT
ncbi:MAG: 3-hydroxyacyl-CoA dehydrogenase family protein [Acidimicrobiales bacterium]